MKNSRDMFAPEGSKMQNGMNISSAGVLAVALSIITLISLICIAVDFEAVTVKIATVMASLLTSGVFILIVLLTIFWMWCRFTWRVGRRFWRW